jgi:hypothetical protein
LLISSLRELLPAPKASGADDMQPDASPQGIDLRRDRIATFGFLAACVVALEHFILRGKAKCTVKLHSLLKFKGELRRVRVKTS